MHKYSALHRTKNCVVVPIKNGSYLIYNRLLNNPIVLDPASFVFFSGLETVNYPFVAEGAELELLECLAENGFLLKEDSDESTILATSHAQYLSELSEGKTLVFLDLRISEKCNFGCKHCLIGRSDKSQPIMKKKLAIDIIDAFMACSTKGNVDLHFGNAEPFLNFRVLQAAYQHLSENYPEIKRRVSVNTNLSLLTEEMAKFLVESEITAYVSLDGEKQANDAIRIFKKGGGTFDTIVEKMHLLEASGHPIDGISVTITDLNYRFFGPEFIDWCHEQGYTSLGLDFDLVNPLLVSVDERVEILHSMWLRTEELGIEFFGTWMTPFVNLTSKSILSEEYAFCKGIQGRSFSVGSDGNMHICGYSETSLGHFSEMQANISPGGKLYELVKSRLVGQVEGCRGCEIEGACAGQCFVTCEASAEKVWDQCDFFRKVTRKFLATYAEMEEV